MSSVSGDTNKQTRWSLEARLVDKLIFTKRGEDGPHFLLVLIYIDANGQLYEVKTWRQLKAHCVYRKVHIDESYSLVGVSTWRPPDKNYSTAKSETFTAWRVDPLGYELSLNKYLSCFTSIQKALKLLNQQKPVNILGSFLSITQGPGKHYVRGKFAIQGYYVTLVDELARSFRVLVWHTVRVEKSKFSLFGCHQGDIVLILYARQGNGQYQKNTNNNRNILTLTSVQPPVVNPSCVSPDSCAALHDSFNISQPINPFFVD